MVWAAHKQWESWGHEVIAGLPKNLAVWPTIVVRLFPRQDCVPRPLRISQGPWGGPVQLLHELTKDSPGALHVRLSGLGMCLRTVAVHGCLWVFVFLNFVPVTAARLLQDCRPQTPLDCPKN